MAGAGSTMRTVRNAVMTISSVRRKCIAVAMSYIRAAVFSLVPWLAVPKRTCVPRRGDVSRRSDNNRWRAEEGGTRLSGKW